MMIFSLAFGASTGGRSMEQNGEWSKWREWSVKVLLW